MDPSTTELLWVTKARKPIAAALVRLIGPTSALCPTIVLLLPDWFASPAFAPINVLLSPVVTLPALAPKKELSSRVFANLPASAPKKELLEPVGVRVPIRAPK